MTSHNYKSPFSSVQLFVTPWTIACQAPLSMGFSRQEYWSGLPHPPPGDLLRPGIKPASLRSPALADGFFTASATWEAQINYSFGFFKSLFYIGKPTILQYKIKIFFKR